MENYTVIPLDKISPEALEAIIEEFIMREGTDYGLVEKSMSEKKSKLLKQIKTEDVKIVYDQLSETVTLLTEQQFKKITTKI